MNQFYKKYLFIGIITGALITFYAEAGAQRLTPNKHREHSDLIASVKRVQQDQLRISNVKKKIKESREANNRKALKIHQKKLDLEKKVFKTDYAEAKEEERTYVEKQNARIKTMTEDVKNSKQHYELTRKKIKKDLAKRNDYALQKEAAELLKTVQKMNEQSTELAMEKSDFSSTKETLSSEWKKVKMNARESSANFDNHSAEKDFTTVK